MSGASRKGLAVVAASATLGAVLVTPVATASSAPPPPPASDQRGLLDPVAILLGLLNSTLSADAVQGLLDTLGLDTPPLLADVLAAANPQQLAILLDALTLEQLDGALGNLTPEELLGVLTDLGGGDLAAVFELLDPAQITGLLSLAGGLTQVVEGLEAVIAGITAGTPVPGDVDALLSQLMTVLGAVNPSQLGSLDGLLAQVAPLLSVAGLDAGQLALLTTLLQGLTATPGVGQLLAILLPGGVPLPTPTATATPTPGPGATPPPTVNTAFRATVRAVKVTRNRRGAKMRVTCPATAPGCLVAVTGLVGAKSAFKMRAVVLAPGASKPVNVKLVRTVAKRLRKGGTLRVKAVTAGSTLGAATAKTRVKRKK